MNHWLEKSALNHAEDVCQDWPESKAFVVNGIAMLTSALERDHDDLIKAMAFAYRTVSKKSDPNLSYTVTYKGADGRSGTLGKGESMDVEGMIFRIVSAAKERHESLVG